MEASAVLTGFVVEEEKIQEIRKFDRIPEASILEKLTKHFSSLRVNLVLSIVSLFLIVSALTQPAAVMGGEPCPAMIPALAEDKIVVPEVMFDSTILTTIDEQKALKNLLGESRNLTLLYRGSRDGFRKHDFHKRCDGRKDTVTVVQAQ